MQFTGSQIKSQIALIYFIISRIETSDVSFSPFLLSSPIETLCKEVVFNKIGWKKMSTTTDNIIHYQKACKSARWMLIYQPNLQAAINGSQIALIYFMISRIETSDVSFSPFLLSSPIETLCKEVVFNKSEWKKKSTTTDNIIHYQKTCKPARWMLIYQPNLQAAINGSQIALIYFMISRIETSDVSFSPFLLSSPIETLCKEVVSNKSGWKK